MKKSYQSLEDNSTNNMKQVIHRKLTSNILHLGLIILLTFTTSLHAQEGDPAKGKALFNTNCAACHKLDKKMTGPALRNIEQKIADDAGLDRKWITAWIHNSSGLIKSGDAYANKIFKEYNGVAMTAFPQLSDQDISDILAYTAEVPKEKPAQATDATASQQAAPSGGTSNKLILGALALLFGLLAIALVLVRQTLNRFAEAKGVAVPKDKNESLWKAFVQNQFLVIVVTIFLVLSASYFAFGYLMQVGVDQNYQPVQPIHYSHRIHAGDNGIDCKYCHSSARVSKTSGIPSLNVCMNCHKSISEVAESTATPEYSKEFYDGEIQKLYKAAGWSDADQKYTGEPQPVKWVRIHNLPDFAYFNHSQHVTVGGIECQTCHGPVETMEVVYQYSPLTMGWCINCHRTTNVKVEDNAYYTKIHEQLSKKYGVDKLTVAQMGGMECGKCHY
jgi:cytochrome c551/c552